MLEVMDAGRQWDFKRASWCSHTPKDKTPAQDDTSERKQNKWNTLGTFSFPLFPGGGRAQGCAGTAPAGNRRPGRCRLAELLHKCACES